MDLTFENIFAFLSAVLVIATIFGSLISIPKLKRYWPAFRKYCPLLLCLVSRDVKVKYRRSVLGILWSVLQPLFIMLIITAVFSNVFRIEVENYPVYYITGSFIFNFVLEATSISLTSIIGAAPLIKKVYIPKYIFPLQKCLFALVNMAFSLIAVAIVYLILQTEVHPTMGLFFVPMIYAAVFSFGLSLILSALEVFFRDVAHLYAVWATAWMYLTPILYPLNILPQFLQDILQLNPLVYYVNYARDVMMYGVVPGLNENLVCIGFALSTLLVGLLVFKKAQDRFILHI
jgi:ABC-2 type transport system permease protein